MSGNDEKLKVVFIKIRRKEIEFCCFFSQRLKTLRKVFDSFIRSEFNINQERAKCKIIFHINIYSPATSCQSKFKPSSLTSSAPTPGAGQSHQNALATKSR